MTESSEREQAWRDGLSGEELVVADRLRGMPNSMAIAWVGVQVDNISRQLQRSENSAVDLAKETAKTLAAANAVVAAALAKTDALTAATLRANPPGNWTITSAQRAQWVAAGGVAVTIIGAALRAAGVV